MAFLTKIFLLQVIIFGFCSSQILAQRYDINDIDSLKKVSVKLKGKDKVKCLNWISELSWQTNIDSSIHYAKKALVLAKKINDKIGIAFAYNNLGGSYFYNCDYYNALKYFKIALKLRKELGQKNSEAAILYNMSTIYISLCIYDKALECNYQSLKICEEIDDNIGVASVYFLNAYIFSEQQMYEKAISMYQKASKLFKVKGDSLFYATALNNIGSNYLALKKLDLAFPYLNKSLKISKSINNLFSLANVIDNIGRYYAMNKMYDSAIVFHHQAIAILQQLKSSDISGFYISLANVYLETDKMDSVLFYLNRAHEHNEKTDQKIKRLDIFNLYTHYYEKTNNPEKALEYLKLYNETKDSIQSEKYRNKLIDKQLDYETEKHHAEKLIQELKIKRNKNQRNLSVFGAFFILALAIFIFSRYRLKKRTNNLLIQKNIELEIANNTKDKFFAIIAHDLKNHLVAFQTVSQSLSENYETMDDTRKQHLITRLWQSSITLYRTMENLLTWSLSQLKRIEFNPIQLDLCSLIEKEVTELQHIAARKQININNNINTQCQIYADENMLTNVIRNLITNAIKFSDFNAIINISVEDNNTNWKITIKDNGCGIAENDIKKLFRVDVDHKTIGSAGEKGTGLGLILSKEFVTRHHGMIWVESIEGQGSTFFISLPKKNQTN